MNSLGTYHTDEDSYRKQWATLTGRSEREVYVPVALRTDETLPILKPPYPPRPEGDR